MAHLNLKVAALGAAAFLAGSAALLCHRRARSPNDPPVWAMHVLSLEGRSQGSVEWETDRARFIGRGHDTDNPVGFWRHIQRKERIGHGRMKNIEQARAVLAKPCRRPCLHHCARFFLIESAVDKHARHFVAQNFQRRIVRCFF